MAVPSLETRSHSCSLVVSGAVRTRAVRRRCLHRVHIGPERSYCFTNLVLQLAADIWLPGACSLRDERKRVQLAGRHTVLLPLLVLGEGLVDFHKSLGRRAELSCCLSPELPDIVSYRYARCGQDWAAAKLHLQLAVHLCSDTN